MAACQATLPLPSVSRVPAQASPKACSKVASPSRLRPRSVRDLFRMKSTPACRKTMEARARLGGDVDVNFNGDATGEDFYSVLGLVHKYL